MRPLRYLAQSEIYDLGDLAEAKFHEALLESGLPAIASEAWSTDSHLGAIDAEIQFEVADKGGRSLLLRKDGVLGWVHVYRRGGTYRVDANVAAPSMEEAQPLMQAIAAAFPKHEVKGENVVNVKFWMLTKNNPHAMERDIVAPPFDVVRDNYPAEVAKQLEEMIGPEFEPGRGGQLLLWHGMPGTGKTYALRALANAWREWCTIEYVTDPEKFFGEASYLMPVLLSEADHEEGEDEGKWRLLIFEDTGELLSADARARAGQGLSRLLNVVDGFIGQGLRILILITTNEEITKLHDAVQRPGRCAVAIKYDRLSADESQQWARSRGFKVPHRPHTVAELYATQGGQDTRPSEPFGFRPVAV